LASTDEPPSQSRVLCVIGLSKVSYLGVFFPLPDIGMNVAGCERPSNGSRQCRPSGSEYHSLEPPDRGAAASRDSSSTFTRASCRSRKLNIAPKYIALSLALFCWPQPAVRTELGHSWLRHCLPSSQATDLRFAGPVDFNAVSRCNWVDCQGESKSLRVPSEGPALCRGHRTCGRRRRSGGKAPRAHVAVDIDRLLSWCGATSKLLDVTGSTPLHLLPPGPFSAGAQLESRRMTPRN